MSEALELAVRTTYRDEIAKLKMQLVRYREFILENGLEPPDMEGADLLQMWRDCEQVTAAAQNCVANLGPAVELLSGRWR